MPEPLFALQLYYNTGTNKQYNGNIMYQYWGTPGSLTNAYTYLYDKLNRLVNGGTNTVNKESTGYDQNGNITALNSYQVGTQIDQLTYTYTVSGFPTNQLQSVGDASGNNAGLVNGTTNYTYDGNGSMLTQTNTVNTGQNKTIKYNILNLPDTVTTPTTSIKYYYTATGEKVRKVSVTGTTTTVTVYDNGIQYLNTGNTVDFVQTEEGKAVLSGAGANYTYYMGDNLGNTRVTFETKTLSAVVIQKDDYYPFGMEINSQLPTPPTAKNEYLYNKKELQEELQQYDYGARFYDPVIGRWGVIDPLAEASQRWSPYSYVENNPIGKIDPDGKMSTQPGADGDNDEAWSVKEAKRLQSQQQQQEEQKKQQQKQGKTPKDIFVHNKDGSILKRGGGAVLRPEVLSNMRKGLDKVAIIEGLTSLGTMIVDLFPKAPVVDEEEVTSGGAARAQKYSSGWGNGSLNEAINKFAPDAEAVQNGSKIVYKNDQTGVQVVYDDAGNYFRIQDTKLTGKRQYTDMNGAVPNNKVVNGKQTGRSQAEYNQVTHFNNSDR